MRSTPGTAPTVVSGHGAIQPDLLSTLPSTLAIFGLRQHGVLVSEGSVLNSGSFTGGRVFAEVNSTTNTGISLVSTRLQPQIQPTQTVVSFYFTDVEGITVRTGTLTLEANQQFTAFLNEPPFNGGNSLVGTFTFESSQSINAVAFRGFVNERSEFLLTALPIVPLDATTSASLVVPHFADGGGWRTRVVLVNPTNSAVNGKIEFLDHSGFVSAVADYAVTPRGSSNVQTDGIATETDERQQDIAVVRMPLQAPLENRHGFVAASRRMQRHGIDIDVSRAIGL